MKISPCQVAYRITGCLGWYLDYGCNIISQHEQITAERDTIKRYINNYCNPYRENWYLFLRWYLPEIWPLFITMPSSKDGSFVFNSMAPGKCVTAISNVYFWSSFFELIFWPFPVLVGTSCAPQNPSDCKSALVQAMAWCRQATILCLNQCWHRSMSPT